ncbi:RNA polymerase sigma factor [Novosphingobium resinovorum]|uniref:RNA polymerase sigma factor n=1 Tax=Novosphingobium resinovorum TaxID=158500 RepID=A0A1D8A318_9SPHN|nr:sigma-70 family RNA polymerase sigma factor [Novosphingobium resinovorum]AOR76541.1 hypothetical protein BES08_07125 [Novosphingobium resinovorum]
MTFDHAYRSYRARLAHYIRRRCAQTPLEAEDVLQETFLQAWRAWSNRTTDNVLAWLTGVARRVFAHLLREANRVKRGAGSDHVSWAEEDDQRAAPAPQEAAVLLDQLRQRAVTLGPAQRAAVLGVMNDLTVSEIAERGAVSIQSVSAALKLARLRLTHFA